MYSTTLALALAFLFFQYPLIANAGVYVLKPAAHSTCHGGQACTIEWVDDGVNPLLAAAGLCTFGLYTGDMQLVQAIPPTDVSTIRSITFKPNPAAGPNSDSYYIAIISTTAKENSSDPFPTSYKAFSPFFTIDQMVGSFESPLPEATSTTPIPSSLTRSPTGSGISHSTTKLSTITVGTLSTSLPPLPTLTVTSPIIKSSTTSAIQSQAKLSTSKLPSSAPTSSVQTSTGTSGVPISTVSPNGAMGRVPPVSALSTAAFVTSLFFFTFL